MEFPKRKKNRLNGYDYANCGAYFVTVCTSPRRNLFWETEALEKFLQAVPDENVGADIIRPNPMGDVFLPGVEIIRPYGEPLSPTGKIVREGIAAIPQHYASVEVEHYCIMPDHLHMLLMFLPDENGRMISAPTLSTVVGSMKRWISRRLGRSIWQKSFYDRVIRSEKGYQAAWSYIEENPMKWWEDHGDGPFP